MKASKDYLEEALAKLDGRSDSENAKQLKIAHNTLSQYRSGARTMDNFACIMVGRVLGIDPMKIIAACEEERARNEEKQGFWRDFQKTLGVAVVAPLAAMVMMTASPEAHAASVKTVYDKCLLCQICAVVSYATTPLPLDSFSWIKSSGFFISGRHPRHRDRLESWRTPPPY